MYQVHSKVGLDFLSSPAKQETRDLNQTMEIIKRLPQDESHKLKRIANIKCSARLSIYPTNDTFVAVSSDEFRDALAIWYHIRPKGVPAICDGCRKDFTVNHALNRKERRSCNCKAQCRKRP